VIYATMIGVLARLANDGIVHNLLFKEVAFSLSFLS
jgi:hypothetical protein